MFCLPSKEGFGACYIASTLVQAVFSGCSYTVRYSWRGRCRQADQDHQQGRESKHMNVLFRSPQYSHQTSYLRERAQMVQISTGCNIWSVTVNYTSSCEGLFEFVNCFCMRALSRPPRVFPLSLLKYFMLQRA